MFQLKFDNKKEIKQVISELCAKYSKIKEENKNLCDRKKKQSDIEPSDITQDII